MCSYCLRERENPRRPQQAFSKLYQHFRVRGHPYGLQDTLSTLRPSCSSCVRPRLRHGRKTRYGWVARPYPTRTFTLQETPSLSWRENAAPQPRPEAAATQERSNCLGCQGALYVFLALDRLGLPGRPMLQHSIEDGQKRMHTGRQGDFFHLSRSQEPFVKGFDPRVVARGDTGAHVQHRAHGRAASPERPPPAAGPTVAIERRYAHQGGDLLAIEGPSLGEFQQQRPGTHGPNPRGALQQVIVFP